jgi:hypothetical protein
MKYFIFLYNTTTYIEVDYTESKLCNIMYFLKLTFRLT